MHQTEFVWDKLMHMFTKEPTATKRWNYYCLCSNKQYRCYEKTGPKTSPNTDHKLNSFKRNGKISKNKIS